MRMSHFTTWSRHTLSGTVYCTNAIYQVALVSSIVIMRMCSLPSGAFAHAQLDHVAPSGHLAAQIFLLILSARWLKAKAEHRLYTHALMHIYYPQHTHTHTPPPHTHIHPPNTLPPPTAAQERKY